jgi:hypothetical protein
MTLTRRRLLLGAVLAAAGAGLPGCASDRSRGDLLGLWPEGSDGRELRTLARRIAAQHPAIAERARSLGLPGAALPTRSELVDRARTDAAAGDLVLTDGWYLPAAVAVIVVATWSG